jgi:hypothetical protein
MFSKLITISALLLIFSLLNIDAQNNNRNRKGTMDKMVASEWGNRYNVALPSVYLFEKIFKRIII